MSKFIGSKLASIPKNSTSFKNIYKPALLNKLIQLLNELIRKKGTIYVRVLINFIPCLFDTEY